MKRDLDLIRAILLDIESKPRSELLGRSFQIDGVGADEFSEAITLMLERGLIEGATLRPLKGAIQIANVRITWSGHDFLDSVRDEEIWEKTKEGAVAAGGFTFDLIKALAKGLIKRKIEQHTGIELDLG